MRSGALVLLATSFLGALAVATASAQPRRTVKPVLHGRHWVAITGKPLAATAGALVFAKGGNAVDAACAMLAATCTMWDTLGWGGETQALVYDPRSKKVDRHQRPRRGADRGDARVLQGEGARLSARVRAARRGHSRDARRAHHDAGRVRPPEPEGRAGAGDPRWPTATRSRRSSRTRSSGRRSAWPGGRTRRRSSSPTRRGPRGAGGRGGLRPEGPRGDPAEARRGRAAGPRRGEGPEGGPPGRLRPLLPRRHRRGARAGDAGAGRAHHEGGPRPLAGEDRGAGQDDLQGHRRLQAHGLDAGPRDAAGPQHPRERRPRADGLQLGPVHPHGLPGDEPGLRRPRLLLRRPGVPARGAGRGPPLEGLRQAALRHDAQGRQRPRRPAGRPLPVPGRQESREGPPRRLAHRAGDAHGSARARPDRRRDELRRGLSRRAPRRSSPPTPRAGSSR